MANWKEVTERWLPIVENMEEHHMDDYAIPEIYRAAEKRIDAIRQEIGIKADYIERLEVLLSLSREAIRKHKGD